MLSPLRNMHKAPLSTLFENMMSSTKLELTTSLPWEDLATVTVNMHKKFGEVWPCSFRYNCEQTDKQTYVSQ